MKVYHLVIGLFLVIIITSCRKPILKKKANASIANKNAFLVSRSRNYIGIPYKYGGTDESGLDCSGLIYLTFKNLGVFIPRVSGQQALFYPSIDKNDIQVGDLVYFKVNSTTINHTGIVSKIISKDDIWFIHASTSKGVVEDRLLSTYWKPKFCLASRPQF